MARNLTTAEAMQVLGTSRPTVLALIEHGHLSATKIPRGQGFCWRIDEASVLDHLAVHGRYDKERSRGRSRLARLEAEVESLREEVRALAAATAPRTDERSTAGQPEHPDVLARMVDLEEALQRAQIVAELQREADNHRAEVVRCLLAALAESEQADSARRRALSELEEALAGFSLPKHLGEMRLGATKSR